MALESLVVSETYADLEILTQLELHTAMVSIENWVTVNNLDITQLALDVFGNTYVFNNDGIQTVIPAFFLQAALKNTIETITQSWTFQKSVAFQDEVTSTSTFSSSGQMRCKANLVTLNQTIPNNAFTLMAWNSSVYNIGNMHDNAILNSRLVVPTSGAGLYNFTAQIKFAVNNVGNRIVALFKNGLEAARVTGFACTAIDTSLQLSFDDQASAADFYEIFVYQDSGGVLDVLFGVINSSFACMKVW